MIRNENKQKRLAFAIEKLNEGTDFADYIFTDESCIQSG